MTVQKYLDAPFDETVYIRWQKRRGRLCTGPNIIHLQWDIKHCFCELYRDDGSAFDASLQSLPLARGRQLGHRT